MDRCFFRYESMKSVKNQDKSINETSVSSISTDWSIESISIRSLNDFSRFIDWQIRYWFLSIDYSGSTVRQSTVSLKSILLLDNSILIFFYDFLLCEYQPLVDTDDTFY